MESNGPRIFTKEVFHRKEQHEGKGETRDHRWAKRGPTMWPSFLLMWWGPSSPLSVAPLPPFVRPPYWGKTYVIFWGGGGGKSPLLHQEQAVYATPWPPTREIRHHHHHQHPLDMGRSVFIIIYDNITITIIISSEIYSNNSN
jgi:hypothetical protein